MSILQIPKRETSPTLHIIPSSTSSIVSQLSVTTSTINELKIQELEDRVRKIEYAASLKNESPMQSEIPNAKSKKGKGMIVFQIAYFLDLQYIAYVKYFTEKNAKPKKGQSLFEKKKPEWNDVTKKTYLAPLVKRSITPSPYICTAMLCSIFYSFY